MPAALGFATIAVLLLLTMTERASVVVALILLPVLAALIGGFAGDPGELILGGLSKAAPSGIMIAFAVLYFSLMAWTATAPPPSSSPSPQCCRSTRGSA